MFTKILVPIDPSFDERQRAALQSALKLADDTLAEVQALTVVEPAPLHIPPDFGPTLEETAGPAAMAKLRAFLGDQSEIRSYVRHGKAAHEILEHAKENDVECIVIASHRPELADYLLGSTAARVVRHAACSVLVLR